MRKFYTVIVSHRKTVMTFFIVAAICCIFLQNMVAVNYDMNDYLPEDTHSTVSLDVMEEEFDGGIPNARVMARDVTIPQALEYKEQIEEVSGVTDVTWLDDAIDITLPLEVMDDDTVETYYKDNTALFSVTIEEDSRISAISEIRGIIGDDNAVSGSAASTADATIKTVSEIRKITVIGVIFVLIVLILTTRTWIEPILILAGAEVPTEYLDEDTLSQLISDHYSRMVLSVDVPYEGEKTFSLVEEIRAIAQKYYPDSYYLAGEGVSTYDLMDTVMADMVKVNLLAIGAVFLVLLLTLQSISLPVILVLSIETAIWINLSFPYFLNDRIFYIAYLIISSIQLGATVDYAILMTDRYKENRQTLGKKEAVVETLANVSVSILTSGSVLTVVGFLLGHFSSNQLLAQLGIFIGRGALCSLFIVLFVLPGLLYLFDRLVIRDKKKGLRNCEATEQIQACKEFGKETVSGKGGSVK